MSEFIGPNELRPQPTASQERAFMSMHTAFFKQAYMQGEPICVLEMYQGDVACAYEDFFEHRDDMEFEDDGRVLPRTLPGNGPNGQHSFLTILNEDGVAKTGIVGTLTINDNGFNSHPASIYVLHTDSNVEHLRRTDENDGLDEENYPINWRDTVEHAGWLKTDDMTELRLRFGA